MSCNDLDFLQENYAEAVRDFTASVKKLRAHVADVPTTEYLLLSKLAEQAKVKADATRRAPRNHVIEHGCC